MRANRGQGPLLQFQDGTGVGADLVRDGRAYRRGSRMRSAPTLPTYAVPL